mgnify:CR=1 FL=1
MKKSRFIAGWEIDFVDPEQLTKILLTQGIDKSGFELFSEIQTATELVIDGNRIVESIQHSEDNQETEKMDISLPISDWPDRKAFYLEKDTNGIHNIGGPTPTSFKIPHHSSLKSNFIYIGTLDCSDPKFKWMNLEKLHISYPVFEGAFEIFLNYQDPNAPVLLNPETFDYSWIDDNVKGVDKVQFVAQKYKTVDKVDIDELNGNDKDYLLCGVPLWYQYPQIPTCPKTGKVMQFVATINSDSDLGIQNENGVDNLPFGNRLIFGDEGHLYVFYEPESKVLYLNVQF